MQHFLYRFRCLFCVHSCLQIHHLTLFNHLQITLGAICSFGASTVCGTSSLDESTMIERLTAHFQAGTSVKDLDHYEQFIDSKPRFFGRYDYGASGNEREYGAKTPPAYNLSGYDTAVPLALFTGSHDDLVAPDDLAMLEDQLPTGAVVFNKSYDTFSHLTWLVGKESTWEYFQDLVNLIQKYNGSP